MGSIAQGNPKALISQALSSAITTPPSNSGPTMDDLPEPEQEEPEEPEEPPIMCTICLDEAGE